MTAEGRSGGGRRALGRVVLVSLADRTRAELEERRARGQRLRAQRALRRLEELELALDRFDRGLAPLPRPWYLGWGSYAGAILLLAATAGLLACSVTMNGASGLLVGIADGAMLAATLVWFSLAVARRTPRARVAGRPPNEGSAAPDEGR